jgi:hypothetical protein
MIYTNEVNLRQDDDIMPRLSRTEDALIQLMLDFVQYILRHDRMTREHFCVNPAPQISDLEKLLRIQYFRDQCLKYRERAYHVNPLRYQNRYSICFPVQHVLDCQDSMVHGRCNIPM